MIFNKTMNTGKEIKLRMFVRVHIRIFGPKTCEMRKTCTILVGNETFNITVEKCEEKGHLGPPTLKWNYIS
jgi:hypothetical protein